MDYLEEYKQKISEANKVWREDIITDNPSLLRDQIRRTFACIPDMATLASKAERDYRQTKMDIVLQCPSDFKGEGRRLWVDGKTSGIRYQRDVLESLHRGLINKLSAQKSILASLVQEMRDIGLDEH
jgi:hypothetical protein